ncbi:MAG TPA: CocE/NonD family hydrolase [Xanthobacteraceae bacterium]|nr:CocE/NonD family hydrolase [Xanthobacteraceae bacterium]
MAAQGFEYRYRSPRSKPEERGGKPPAYSRTVENEHAMIIERDVVVTMRDGTKLYADVFRPADERPVPPIIAWTPYGKHVPFDPKRFLNAGVKDGDTSKYTAFEAPDPTFWIPHGYAVVVIDVRGTWYSEGTAHYLAPEEAQDFYDAVEWAGTQPWSNGKVGLSGVSYLAQLQWRVAELNPPHLAAINPWEGWTDSYREVATHGGIPDTHFWPSLWNRWGAGTGTIEDLEAETKEHPLFDDFWRSKAVDFSKIKVPAFVVASWTDQGLHTRGTFEGFKHIASPQKWLLAHGQKKWAHYYVPENMRRLHAFFDHFLKGLDNEVKDWPKVMVEVRERNGVGTFRVENEWPLARTQYTKLFLNAARGSLEAAPVREAASASYDSVVADLAPADRATFDITFDKDTELTGYMKLRVFMSCEASDDMDVFVGLHKLDKDGKLVPFAYYAQFDDGPVALGWLRASHRELDPGKSTEWQPVHPHTREQKIKPGEIVPLDIEIWPSGTRFAAGETLRLIVQGDDLNRYPVDVAPVYFRHKGSSVNKGRHVIHAGGSYESYLLVPVIPPK